MALLTLGCDPELLAIRKSKYIPAWTLTGGTKAFPEVVKHIQNTYGLKAQADGVTLEFNIDPVEVNVPEDVERFVNIITSSWQLLCDVYKCSLQAAPVIRPAKWPDINIFKHPLCQVSGCDPDFDAYSPGLARAPLSFENEQSLRFAGGHVHVGYDTGMCREHIFAKFMDLFVAMAITDKQGERRAWYGSPGIFRPKPYGMEYRTLGPRWVETRSLTRLIGRNIYALVHALTNYPTEMREFYKRYDWNQCRDAIATEHSVLMRSQLALRDEFLMERCPETYALVMGGQLLDEAPIAIDPVPFPRGNQDQDENEGHEDFIDEPPQNDFYEEDQEDNEEPAP